MYNKTLLFSKGLIKITFYSFKLIVILDFIFTTMKHFYYYILLIMVFISCQEKVSPESISKINGYWEIVKVQMPDGQEKEYSINEMIDYIEWNGKTGFRKKVTPQFDGKYLVNDETESIVVTDSLGHFCISYQTNYAKWKEEILQIKDSVLVLKNDQEIEYHYKRFKPISIQ